MSVVISEGVIAFTNEDLNGFYSHFNAFWGKHSQTERGYQPIDLTNFGGVSAFDEVVNNHQSIGLGIRITGNVNGKVESVSDVVISNIFPVLPASLFLVDLDGSDFYILERKTCLLIRSLGENITRLKYARHEDGRLLIYLLTNHESNYPVRIPHGQ